MITRDNYQEFFLLYLDNELSAAGAREVEEWVAANPDLKEEWESLQLCRVTPDEKVIFSGKDRLLRAGDDSSEERALTAPGSPGHTAAGTKYADRLMSYIDDELTSEERQQVEALIAVNPAAAAELEQLRLTVSSPDTTIIFPDKSSLYRKEKDRRVIVLLRTLAGAAAVLVIAIPLLIKKAEHPVTPDVIAALHDQKPPATQRPTPQMQQQPDIANRETPQPPHGIREPREPRSDRNQDQQLEPREPRSTGDPDGTREPQAGHNRHQQHELRSKADPQQPREPRSATDQEQTRELQKHQKQPNPQPTRDPRPIPSQAAVTDLASGAPPQPAPTTEIKSTQPLIASRQAEIPQNEIPSEQSSFATQALLQEYDEKTPSTASERTPPNKSKLRGLFRKVARTFGSTADADGKREVLISAFQVAVN